MNLFQEALSLFEEAVKDLAWLGTQPPGDHNKIRERYSAKRGAVLDYVASLEAIKSTTEWSGYRRGPGTNMGDSGGDEHSACPVCLGLEKSSPGFSKDAVGHRSYCVFLTGKNS